MKLSNLITEQSKYTIYCDMDGVLTDFSGDFMKLAHQIGEVELEERTDVPNNAAAKYEKAHKENVIGRAKGYLPYIGMVTSIMNDYPIVKYILVGLMGLFVLTTKE